MSIQAFLVTVYIVHFIIKLFSVTLPLPENVVDVATKNL